MRGLWLVLCFGVAAGVSAQAPQAKSDAEIKTEAAQAQGLYDKNNLAAALPLFEDLHAQQPASLMYQERLAMCLLNGADGMSAEQDKANHARAKQLLLDAKSKGDDSPLLNTLLEKMGDGDGFEPPPTAKKMPAQMDFA